MRRHRHLLFATGAVALIGCAVTEEPQDTTAAAGPSEAYLDSVMTTFISAMKAKDPTAFMGYYADNAVSYPPNAAPIRGKPAIVENNKQWFASIEVDSVAAVRDDLISGGDVAVEAGRYYFRGKIFGQAAADSGRYINVWQRQADGSWKIVRDMSNSSAPVPGAPPPAGSAKQ